MSVPVGTSKQSIRVVNILTAGTKQLHAVHVRLVAQSYREEILVVTVNARTASKVTVFVFLHLKMNKQHVNEPSLPDHQELR